MYLRYLSSNSSNENAVNEARRIRALALKEASLVADVYVSTVEFEIEHGNDVKATFFARMMWCQCHYCYCISVCLSVPCMSK